MSKQHQKKTNLAFELNDELKVRREKLNFLRKYNIAFPNDFRCSASFDKLHASYDSKKELKSFNIEVSVAGRIITRRIMGQASFITLQDLNGQIQLYITSEKITKDIYNDQFKKWDLGDIIGARGKLFKTRTGELSVYCDEIRLLTKSLRPLPNKFHGLSNQETCYRQRYLDLIANNKSRYTFKVRSKIIAFIRQFMENRDFIEVETPMVQIIPGGASARPFITHYNALNLDMYLRIAPELYLKRLIVGGFNRVFEINRNFRNEGVSPHHNPEFTMMELYMAYADYNDLINLTECLFRSIAQNILGTLQVTYGEKIFNFSKPFQRFTMKEAIKKYCPEICFNDLEDLNKTISIAQSLKIEIERSWSLGRIITEIFKEAVEVHLIQPTFITEYPIDISPLARRNDTKTEITDRFEFFIGGIEIGNGFSELNDSEDQAIRFQQQVNAKNRGDDEAMFYDEDYIMALEYGMPPTAGLGLGIDRIIMLFTNNNNIRDVLLFPALRPA
ncbi:lysine--tRNA ligase [Pantoea sp. Aalb]|uniref:lysine--tRNA ligase n=1 Tax=Pantoea sp. Aalb TaxID=2576762 RepID=UPI0013236E4F|nr:lysine--tRNA ligase [Pantoea sp. Aalb]MXP67740.1 lysine--tRNA ligase [Pantoea sp. Aalb]